MNRLQGTLNRQIGLCGEEVIKKCLELEGKKNLLQIHQHMT